MKKTTFTILFMAFSLFTFAQSAFTEKIFNDKMLLYKNSTSEFMKNETVPDFMLVGTSGNVYTRDAFIAMAEGGTTLTSDFSNVKIRQYGNTAIITGLWAHSHRLKHNNMVVAYKELFTYTFNEQKGKWLLLSAQHSEAPIVVADEEMAIKKVIEKETQAWLARDAESMTACWANTDYALMAVYHGVMASNNGVAYYSNTKKNAPETIKTLVGGMGKPDGSTFKNENYVIRVSGASAFVSFDQTTTNGDGSKTLTYSTRYLERINGEWKIVYVGSITHK